MLNPLSNSQNSSPPNSTCLIPTKLLKNKKPNQLIGYVMRKKENK
jgi:hypothetical protein